jgi:site-specific recombinase XerC
MTARTPAERRQQAHALPPVPTDDAAAIAAFLDAIWAESGLARPTLDSYRRDLEGFARWRNGRDGGLSASDRAGLFDYLAWRTREGYSPRSNATRARNWRRRPVCCTASRSPGSMPCWPMSAPSKRPRHSATWSPPAGA